MSIMAFGGKGFSMKLFPMMLAGSAVLALAACGKGGEQGATGSSAGNQSVEEVASEIKKISIQPGEWETTQEITDVKVEGAPEGMPAGMFEAMKGRKTTVRTCITPEQAEKPSADFLTAQKDSKCTYSGFEMVGGAMKGAVSCPAGEGGMAHMTMAGTYTPTSYAMDMEMRSEGMGGAQMPGMTMAMKMKTTGKRLGDCPAGSAAKE